MILLLINFISIVAIIIICFYTYFSIPAQNTCLSPNKEPVDWFIIYLLPKDKDGEMKFAYIDNQTDNFAFLTQTSDNFPPIHITTKLNNKENSYLIWNDQTETLSSNANFAHSKGVLAIDKQSGFYLIHSLPQFPEAVSDTISSNLPKNAGFYGQTFFCMSISYTTVGSILDGLMAIRPQVFLSYITESQKQDKTVLNKLEALISNKKQKIELSYLDINTLAGININVFLKKQVAELPWDNIIPKHYEDDFFVETWTKPALLPNVCVLGQGTYNIKLLNITNVEMGDTKDHSKWGVSKNKSYVCYGDLNRTKSQEKRQGSIACFKNDKISQLTRNFIVKYEECH
jgi:deoxyribonuclease-2